MSATIRHSVDKKSGSGEVGHFTHFDHIIRHINGADDPSDYVKSFMMIFLAKVNLDVSEMSDAVQDGFLSYESLNSAQRRRIVEEFDSYVASVKN